MVIVVQRHIALTFKNADIFVLFCFVVVEIVK